MDRSEAIIFDMDGVIVDSEPYHKLAFQETCEEIGYGATHGIRFEDYLGHADIDLWQDFVKVHKPGRSLEELMRLKRERLIGCLRRNRPIFKGLLDLVAALACQFKLGLASGSEREVVDEVLQIQNLGDYFQATVSRSDVLKGKPDPEIFLRTAALLQVPPANCWVIEDSKPGVAAGLTAGMRVIAITNTLPASELADATCIASSYQEIQDLLLAKA